MNALQNTGPTCKTQTSCQSLSYKEYIDAQDIQIRGVLCHLTFRLVISRNRATERHRGLIGRKARKESHFVRFCTLEGSIYEIVSNVDDHGIGFVRLDDGLLYETRHCDDRF